MNDNLTRTASGLLVAQDIVKQAELSEYNAMTEEQKIEAHNALIKLCEQIENCRLAGINIVQEEGVPGDAILVVAPEVAVAYTAFMSGMLKYKEQYPTQPNIPPLVEGNL